MKARLGFWLIAIAFGIWLALALLVGRSGGAPSETGTGLEPTVPPATDPTLERQLETAHQANRRLRRQLQASRRYGHNMHQVVLHRPQVVEALNLACATYGGCRTLWRRARCESGLYSYAHNPSGASGLLQFLPSTWQTTPYRWFSIWSPYSNALAAGWMNAHGRGNEWSCR